MVILPESNRILHNYPCGIGPSIRATLHFTSYLYQVSKPKALHKNGFQPYVPLTEHGIGSAKASAAKHLVNDPANLVVESLRGLAQLNPTVKFDEAQRGEYSYSLSTTLPSVLYTYPSLLRQGLQLLAATC